MWQGEELVDDALWERSLPDIFEELDDLRVDLSYDARRMIVAATRGDDADDSQEDDDDAATTIGDSFFNRATSIVCCGHPGCLTRYSSVFTDTDSWHRLSSGEGGSARAIGTMSEVLRHQHVQHSYGWSKSSSSEATRGLVRPPLEVVCAMSSILELHHLDDSTARLIDVDEAEQLTAGYRWLNSRRHKQLCSGWLELVSGMT